MWSDPALAGFALLCLRISDRNKLGQECCILAHDSRGIAAHHSRKGKAEGRATAVTVWAGSAEQKELFRARWTRK